MNSPTDFNRPGFVRTNRIPVDSAALVAIRNLELRARVIIEGFWSGLHRSPVHGFSVEFTEYRQYTPGDDPRYLDWKLFARSDRYYIKKFEDETNLRCLIIHDTSASMDFGSGEITKAEYAKTVAATLAYFMHQQGDAVGLLNFDSQIRSYVPPKNRLGQLRQIYIELDKKNGGKATTFSLPIQQILNVFHKRGMVIVISDFLGSLEGLETGFAQWRAMGHEVLLLQVLDPMELTFDYKDPALFKDLEEGPEVYVEPADARANYLQSFTKHQQSLEVLCSRHGVDRELLNTQEPIQKCLRRLLQARSGSRARR